MEVTIWDLEKHRADTLTEEQHAKLLPARLDEYDTPPLDSILYTRKPDFKSGIMWGYLKEEFWELEHDDPHKAPRELRIAHVKAEIEKLCDQHDVTLEDITRNDPPEDYGADHPWREELVSWIDDFIQKLDERYEERYGPRRSRGIQKL